MGTEGGGCMIEAKYNPSWPARPIDIRMGKSRYYALTLEQAMDFLDNLKAAIDEASVKACPLTRREMVYGPGNTPTFIGFQYEYRPTTTVTIPNVEIKTQGTQRTEQPYKINSEKSDMEQEFI